MRSLYLSILTVTAFSLLMLGCGSGPANTVNTGNTNAASNNPLETTKPAAETVTNDAPTLTPLFKAYCAAKLKNDEAQIKKLYTAGTIQSFEQQMKDDNIKTLTEFLSDEKVAGKCEIKNERISGDTAVATIVTDTYPNGNIEMYFEKENGEWKMTNKSPTFEASKQSNSTTGVTANANTGK